MTQAVLPFIPGYAYDGHRVISTGAAIRPTQHISPKTGEVLYYVRPVFLHGATVGLFVRHQGVVEYVEGLGQDKPAT